MANYTVTIDVADFVPDGTIPRLAFVTFSRLTVDNTTGEIITTAPISIRVKQTPVTVQLVAGVTYKVRADGLAGVGSFYAAATADCTLADLRDSHQIDPISQQPIDRVETVAEAIVAAQAAAAADATAKVAALVAGAPAALDTLKEIADAFGDDPNFLAGLLTDAGLAAKLTAGTGPTAARLSNTYVALRGPWVAGTAYPKNSLVIQGGAVYLAAADVPARLSFTAADWQPLGVAPAPSNLVGSALVGSALAA